MLFPLNARAKENVSDRFRQREGEMKMEWVTRFWRALDAIDKYIPHQSHISPLGCGYNWLSLFRVDLLTTQLPLAKHLRKTILQTGQSIIDKRQIKTLRSFRTTILREDSSLHIIWTPACPHQNWRPLACWGHCRQKTVDEHERSTWIVLAALILRDRCFDRQGYSDEERRRELMVM